MGIGAFLLGKPLKRRTIELTYRVTPQESTPAQVRPRCICCDSQELQPYYQDMFDDRYGFPGRFALLRCNRCGQYVTEPRLEEQDLSEVYTRYYPRHHIDLAALESRRRAKANGVLARLRRWSEGTNNQGQYYAQHRMTVLDVGCGDGASLLELQRLGATGYGVETDRNVVKVATRFGLNIHIGNVYEKPFPGVKFDLIVLNQVIEHIPDPAKLLGVLQERLSENGRIVLSFPNANSLYRRLAGRNWINWHIPYHIHHFNRRSFGRLCRKSRYQVLSSRTVTPNVWTILQFRTFLSAAHEGNPNPLWTPATQNGVGAVSRGVDSTSCSFSRPLKRFAVRMAKMFASAGISVVNRIFDAFGLGDSLVIVVAARD